MSNRCFESRHARSFHCADGGFSTTGMVLALLLSLSLALSSVQVYRVYAICADCQSVADASALAAENQVAAFYTVAQVCDAVSLSLSLTGCTLAGVGLVASCIPPAAGLAQVLTEGSKAAFKAQRTFAEQARKGLDMLQRLLPFLACAQAAAVAAQNNSQASSYLGLAVLFPLQGADLVFEELDTAEFEQQLDSGAESLSQAAQQSAAAQREADESKRRAWTYDCGAAPGYCLYERAGRLAGMEGSANPYYASPDVWSFDVALARAKEYYLRRLAQEQPVSETPDEICASVLRARFYSYACDQMQYAYVHDVPDGFQAYFPSLPRNTDQMRATSLYTESVYPVYEDAEGELLMHAYSACPGAAGSEFYSMGSISWWESERLDKCPDCGLSASQLGKVAQASTSIGNGFEYHYLAIANEAAVYQQKRFEVDSLASQAKQPFEQLMDLLGATARQAARMRIHVYPPGRVGAVALAVDVRGVSPGSLAASGFVADTGSLGVRAAVSAATLADDDPRQADNVIASLADGIVARVAPWRSGSHGVLLEVWGRALFAFNTGRQALLDGIEAGLDGIPLVGAFGLGSWAAGKLQSVLDSWGFEPIDLAAHKPVVVNSYHVAASAVSRGAQGWVEAKRLYGSGLGPGTGNPLSVLVGIAAGALAQRVRDEGDEVVIATVTLLGDGQDGIEISIALPPEAVERSASAVEDAGRAVSGVIEQGTGAQRWR